jgi:hypothetical protein
MIKCTNIKFVYIKSVQGVILLQLVECQRYSYAICGGEEMRYQLIISFFLLLYKMQLKPFVFVYKFYLHLPLAPREFFTVLTAFLI